MTIDEIKGKVIRLQKAKQSEDVKFWLQTLKELADNMLVMSYNEKGEDAVRALGVQKGLNMAQMLCEIFESQISADAKSKIVKV